MPGHQESREAKAISFGTRVGARTDRTLGEVPGIGGRSMPRWRSLPRRSISDRSVHRRSLMPHTVRASRTRCHLSAAEPERCAQRATTASRGRSRWSRGWPRATSVARITLSDGHSHGERSPSRRSGAGHSCSTWMARTYRARRYARPTDVAGRAGPTPGSA
jgi:hypothetical protein